MCLYMKAARFLVSGMTGRMSNVKNASYVIALCFYTSVVNKQLYETVYKFFLYMSVRACHTLATKSMKEWKS